MPWCKKCNMEYADGITICLDCGETLTDNLEPAARHVLFTGNPEICRRLLEFLQYSNLTSVILEEVEQEASIFISKEELKKACKLAEIFLKEEAKLSTSDILFSQEITEKEDIISETIRNTPVISEKIPSHYIKKADKYQDLTSSAFTLISVGILGILFVCLNAFGILPIRFVSSNFLFYVVMTFLFLVFLIAGFFTLRSAKRLKNEVQEEEIFTKQLTDWFLSSYTAEKIDTYSLLNEELSEEITYFKRIDYMKKELSANFPNLDEAFLDEMLDTFYQKLYEIS